MARVTCENCGSAFDLKDALVGKRVRCKVCGEPTGTTRGLPGRTTTRSTSRKKSSKKSGPPAWVLPTAIGAGVLVAVGLVAWGGMSLWKSVQSSGSQDVADSQGASDSGGTSGSADLLEKRISLGREAAEVLGGVTHPSSAEAAVPRIQALADRVDALSRELQSPSHTMPEWSDAYRQLLRERETAVLRLTDTWASAKQNPEVQSVLEETVAGLSRKLNAFDAEWLRTSPKAPAGRPEDLYAGGGAAPSPDGSSTTESGFLTRDEEHLMQLLSQFPSKYPAEQRVVVVVPSDDTDWLMTVAARVTEITGVGQSRSVRAMIAAPVNDLDEFVACIDFGTVKSVDRARRRIEVEPNPSWTYALNAGSRLAGVGPQPEPADSKPAKPKRISTLKGDGPNGGKMLTTEQGFQIEVLVFAEAGIVQTFVYDAAGKTRTPIATSRIHVMGTDNNPSIPLFPQRMEGDPEGQASEYTNGGGADRVMGALQAGRTPYLSFDLADGTRVKVSF